MPAWAQSNGYGKRYVVGAKSGLVFGPLVLADPGNALLTQAGDAICACLVVRGRIRVERAVPASYDSECPGPFHLQGLWDTSLCLLTEQGH